MSVVAFSNSRRAQAARKRAAAEDAVVTAVAHQPASGALLNAILQYADVHQDLGDGWALLRLSARRRKDPVITALLGREARRLAEVAIIWDEREDEIVRVLDDAQPEPEDMEAGGFALTPAALAYLEAHPTKP